MKKKKKKKVFAGTKTKRGLWWKSDDKTHHLPVKSKPWNLLFARQQQKRQPSTGIWIKGERSEIATIHEKKIYALTATNVNPVEV